MEKVKDFVSIDFEWQGYNHDACAVGLVKVKNGVIVSKIYSLIRPKENVWDKYSVAKHGLTEEMCVNAPTLEEFEHLMEVYIGDFVLVGHNYSTAEKYVIEKHTREDSPLRTRSYIDTYQLSGKSLSDSCVEYDIPLNNHHDALDDATATAMLYMKLQEDGIVTPKHVEKKKGKMQGSKRDNSLNYMVDPDKVPYNDTPFMGSIFVVSGFPDEIRDRIIAFVRDNFGGKNSGSISSKTKVLIGHSKKCGPSKLEKAKSFGTIIYNEQSMLSEIISKYGLENEWNKLFY